MKKVVTALKIAGLVIQCAKFGLLMLNRKISYFVTMYIDCKITFWCVLKECQETFLPSVSSTSTPTICGYKGQGC